MADAKGDSADRTRGAGHGRGEGGRGSSGERARGTSGASEGGRFAGSAPAASRSRALVPGGGEGGGRVRRSGASRVIRGDEPSDSRLAQTEPRERAAPARAGCAAVRSREKSRKNRKKSARPHSLPVLIPRPSTARFRGKRKADGRFIARAVTDWAPRTLNRWVAQRFAACRAALGPRNAVLGRFHRAWRHFSTRTPPALRHDVRLHPLHLRRLHPARRHARHAGRLPPPRRRRARARRDQGQGQVRRQG